MDGKTLGDYAVLAPVYRALLLQRDHFGQQHRVLEDLFCRYGITKYSRILDGACGTGDVLVRLKSCGFGLSWGLDGSAEMVSQAMDLDSGIVERLEIWRWQDLDSYFAIRPPFDFIYMLGHSLPHADSADLPELFRRVASGLRDGGVFAFDMRKWSLPENGSLVQEGRPEGFTRRLGTIEVDSQRIEIHESCTYHSGRQWITYRITPVQEVTVDVSRGSSTISYAMFGEDAAMEYLVTGGFEDVSCRQYPWWPYLVMSGQKKL